jgi:hypothetical protein
MLDRQFEMYLLKARLLVLVQEGVGSITFGRHVSNRLNLCIRNPGVESYRLVCMSRIREGGGGGVPRYGYNFGGGSPVFSGPLPRNSKHIIGILSSSPVNWHPF